MSDIPAYAPPKTELEFMKAMRLVLGEKSRWTKGAWARDSDGFPVMSASSEAVCFCYMGAQIRITQGSGPGVQMRANLARRSNEVLLSMVQMSGIQYKGDGLMGFNDANEVTHEDMMALFDDGIKFLELGEAA